MNAITYNLKDLFGLFLIYSSATIGFIKSFIILGILDLIVI
jgi:hypothetical protein